MFQKSLIAAAFAGVLAIGLSAAPANAWHRHHGGGIVIHIGGLGHGHSHHHCHRYKVKRHGHWVKVKKCHSHRHRHGHH